VDDAARDDAPITHLKGLGDRHGRFVRCVPPGSSKWNNIEHRLFSFITQNCRGVPLVTHRVIVNLIDATTTKTGPTVRSQIDSRVYPKGRRVSDAQLALIIIEPNAYHGEWNYTIRTTDGS
jgi:hypothetical protein